MWSKVDSWIFEATLKNHQITLKHALWWPEMTNNIFIIQIIFLLSSSSAFQLIGMLFMIRFEVNWPGASVHNLSKYFPHKSFSRLLRVPHNRSFFSALIYLLWKSINVEQSIIFSWPDILPLMKSLNFWWKNSDSKSWYRSEGKKKLIKACWCFWKFINFSILFFIDFWFFLFLWG